MSTLKSPSLTIEEAVARMVNMKYMPAGYSLLEMTAAFLETAQADYDSGRVDRLPHSQMASLAKRLDVCMTRHSLTELLLEELSYEAEARQYPLLVLDPDSKDLPRFTQESLFDWAFERFGVGIDIDEPAEDLKWEDVTIQIYSDYGLGWRIGTGKHKRSSFQEIGLIGKRRNEANEVGATMVKMSMGYKYPNGKNPSSSEKKNISMLRRAVTKLTGISSDPFHRFNEGDGWKPRFQLIDDRRNADERAKRRAVHVPEPEAPDYIDEDDAAQMFLDTLK